jgi:hypothetical protein
MASKSFTEYEPLDSGATTEVGAGVGVLGFALTTMGARAMAEPV